MTASSFVNSESLLAIDICDDITRAILFDVADGQYRFISAGNSATTAFPPISDVGQGVRRAIDHLQNLTGRTLLGSDEILIIPSQEDGSGIDSISVTTSVGPLVRVVAVGQVEELSLASACQLATTTYSEIIEKISLSDQRKQVERIDAIIRARPDLIVIAGGTEGGAWRSVIQLLEMVGLACYLLPGGKPEVIFAGNQALQDEIKSLLEPHVSLHFAQNVRPSFDDEQIGVVQAKMAEIFQTISLRKISGLEELNEWADERVMPNATGFGQIISFLSKVYDGNKGVLGIDVAYSATTIAAAFQGNMVLSVYPWMKKRNGVKDLTTGKGMWKIMRWLPMEVSEDSARDYLYNKSIYPSSIAVTPDELAIELALARQVIRSAISEARPGMPKGLGEIKADQLPWFEPIIATGKVLGSMPKVAHSMLILLDALQPSGVTTLVLDQNNLTASLGASAAINPLMVVQVIESSAFVNLGTVIAPIANVRPGIPVLRIRATYETGEEVNIEIKQGDLEIVPLPPGKSARLHLQPLHMADIGMGGPGRSGSVRVMGGLMGVVVDARGRPLRLPEDGGRRRQLLKKWLWIFGIG